MFESAASCAEAKGAIIVLRIMHKPTENYKYFIRV